MIDRFVGVRAAISSPLPPVECARRINDSTRSLIWPFSTGIVGGVYFGHLRLNHVTTALNYNNKPILTGRLLPDGMGTMLGLRYRPPMIACIFYLIWICVFVGVLLTLMVNSFEWASGMSSGENLLTIGFFLLVMILPFAVHFIATRHADEELELLLDFVCQATQGHKRTDL